ncbi:MAG: PAC2 family protein [Chloroflexi bacterium]|nr:PAC2 family protein [Chloroflexota bacterium]
MSNPPKFFAEPPLDRPPLVIGWSVDAARLGDRVTGYLNRKLGGQLCCQIDPGDFFPLGGVAIEDDIIRFPECSFYACPQHNLLVLRSAPPQYDWYRFFQDVLQIAQERYRVREVLTLGGMVSVAAHNTPRELVATFNAAELKTAFGAYRLATGLDYETPPGQRPTLNSFLLWAAMRRGIPGVSLWAPVPFYLIPVDDPTGQKVLLELLSERFGLGLDLAELDTEIARLNELIAGARARSPEMDEAIGRLESNLTLSDEENQKLVTEMEKLLRGTAT